MADADQPDNEWELAKENVQPLRGGRKIANLTAALQPHSAEHLARLKEERKHFEDEIRMYSGDDALDPWYQYIEWTEQNYPTGGKENNLPMLLEKCVEKFNNENCYHSDPRFLDIWIKFANQCNDPQEIYNYLFNQKIGTELAAFYESWSWQFECAGNMKRADNIFKEGIQRGAQPLDLLCKKHQEFEARVARMTMNGELPERPPSPDLCRATLGSLKGHGKKQKAPHSRAVPTEQSRKVLGPKLKSSEPLKAPQVPGAVHSEAPSSATPSLPPQTKEYASVPGKENIKENTQTPGPWNKVKVKPQFPLGASSTPAPATPSFKIHQDPQCNTLGTPRNPEKANVLCAKKVDNDEDLFHNFQKTLQEDSKIKYMYDKALLTGGAVEYSFEEIRAMKYSREMKEKMKEKELEAEKEKIAAERQRMEEEEKRRQEEMRAQQEQIRALHEQIQKMSNQMRQLQVQEQRPSAQQQQRQLWSDIQEKQTMLEETVNLHYLTQQEAANSPYQQQKKRKRGEEEEASQNVDNVMDVDQLLVPQTHHAASAGTNLDSGNTGSLSMNKSSLDTTKTPNTAELIGFNVSKFNSSSRCDNTSRLDTSKFTMSSRFDATGTPDMSGLSLTDSRDVVKGPSTSSMNNTGSGGGGSQGARGIIGGSGGSGGLSSADNSLLRTGLTSIPSSGVLAAPTPRKNISITAPSPTVNTKYAFSKVMGMFNQSLSKPSKGDADLYGWKQADISEDEYLEAQFQAEDTKAIMPGMPSAPFTVYDENAQAPTPFQVFDENAGAARAPAPPAPFQVFDENAGAARAPAPPAPFQVFDGNAAGTRAPPPPAPFQVFDENAGAARGPAPPAPFQVFDENAAATQAPPPSFQVFDENAAAARASAPLAPFQVFDENLGVKSKSSAPAASFPIFDENVHAAKKENSKVSKLPKGLGGGLKKRGLGGVLAERPVAPVAPVIEEQDSPEAAPFAARAERHSPFEVVYDIPMAAADDTVLSQQQQLCDYDEPMDGLECGGDMTFAPDIASTCNFTKMRQMHSTPHTAGSNDDLPEPPVSNIKAPLGGGDASTASAAGVCDASSNMAEHSSGPQHATANTTRFLEQPHKDLSPILELSDESVKAQGQHSSMGTFSSTGGSTINSQKKRHNSAANNTTAPTSTSPPKMSSLTASSISVSTLAPPPSLAASSAPSSTPSVASSVHKSASKSVVPSMAKSLANKSMAKSPDPDIEDFGNMTIDITNYIPVADQLDKTANLNMSVAIDPHNPFDEELIEKFLSRLKVPIQSYPNYHNVTEEAMPNFKVGSYVALGSSLVGIKTLLGEGAYAKVFKAVCNDANKSDFDGTDLDLSENDNLDAEEMVLKVQSPACPWEFYITNVLHQRLKENFPQDNVCASVMKVDDGYFYSDGSCLVNALCKTGTLLDFVNMHKKMNVPISPQFLLYITIELLRIMEQLQACHIIHGDIKPDNFLFLKVPVFESFAVDDVLASQKACVRLIDFGRSIDMKQFPAGTTFMAKVNTSGFECVEMKTDRPWTWQTDLYGIVGTLHVLVFGKYMNVYCSGNKWKMTSKISRYLASGAVYNDLFDSLLNIPSCEELPDLPALRKQFEEVFRRCYNAKEFENYLRKLATLYMDTV